MRLLPLNGKEVGAKALEEEREKACHGPWHHQDGERYTGIPAMFSRNLPRRECVHRYVCNDRRAGKFLLLEHRLGGMLNGSGSV